MPCPRLFPFFHWMHKPTTLLKEEFLGYIVAMNDHSGLGTEDFDISSGRITTRLVCLSFTLLLDIC